MRFSSRVVSTTSEYREPADQDFSEERSNPCRLSVQPGPCVCCICIERAYFFASRTVPPHGKPRSLFARPPMHTGVPHGLGLGPCSGVFRATQEGLYEIFRNASTDFLRSDKKFLFKSEHGQLALVSNSRSPRSRIGDFPDEEAFTIVSFQSFSGSAGRGRIRRWSVTRY